jgi:hexosaminidase
MIRLLLVPGFVVAYLVGCAAPTQRAAVPERAPEIIPLPKHVAWSAGAFELEPATRLVATGGEEARWTAHWLADLLRRTRHLDLEVAEPPSPPSSGVILLELGTEQGGTAPESYRLEVTPERIVVSANDAAGLFYGAVSVWQLATANGDQRAPAVSIPALIIDDAPRFPWRGLMLDSARHFVPPASVKHMLDWMALHKLNVLHWHLTDDQGWRIEIDAYPRLTEVGAWRVPAGPGAATDIDPDTGEPRRYGGFYSKAEIRDIVAYAARRHVTIVPEIEMPGHAQAALAAYPELGTGAAPPGVSADWGVHTWLFGVDDATFEVLETILGEVLELFPGEYIHVGGDEAVKTRWQESPAVQARMRELGVPDETALQSWFVKRIERFLTAHGRKLIGWDEILEGGIAPRATVMSWRGVDGALAAAALGHDTVLAPSPTLYFDHRQSELASEPPGRDAVIPLEDVYRFRPMPDGLAPEARHHVLGIQANLWSEHIRTPRRLAYMAFPRAAALAEIAWSQPARLDWPSFVHRLARQFGRYRALGLPFATSAFDLRASARRQSDGRVAVQLANQSGFGEIRYTTDGSPVTPASALYAETLEVAGDTELAARSYLDGRVVSRELRKTAARLADRRASQELDLCSRRVVLALEDDAPREGPRAVFLTDILNPCWIWRAAELSGVRGIKAAVGQVPFNFQFGGERPDVTLAAPENLQGELEVRTQGCDGEVVAVLPLAPAAQSHGVTVLSAPLAQRSNGADLCLRFRAAGHDPLWVLDWVELERADNATAMP